MKRDTSGNSPALANRKDAAKDLAVEHAPNSLTADRQGALGEGRALNRLPKAKTIAEAARFPEENPNPVLRVAADGTLLYANRASRLLLVAWHVGAEDRIPPRWQDRIVGVLAASDTRTWDEECEGRIFQLSCVPFKEAGYVNIYGVDVTERVALENRLRESEARARDLIRYAPTGIYEVDFRTGRFRTVNDAMCQILGYTRDELLAMSGFDLLDDEGKILFADRIRCTLAGEPVDPSVEYRVIKKDGSAIYGVLSTRITYDDGHPDGAFVIAHDVTERRRARQQLQAAKAELEERVAERTAALTRANEQLRYEASVLANVSDAVIATDENRLIKYINPAAERLSGWRAEEAMGHNPVHLLRAEFLNGTDEDFARSMETEGRWRGEVLVHRRDGTSFYADAAAETLRDETGQLVGHIGVYHDVTVHKRLVQALRAEEEQSRALARRVVAAVENERRNLARELHDQAGQMTWALKLMVGRLRRDLDAEGVHASRFDKIDQLISNVMQELRRLTLDLRPASLDRAGLLLALQEYVEFYRSQSGLTVDLVTLDLGERLAADVETALYRVVQEALTNVVQHAKAEHVRVTVERRGVRVLAAIEDDGQGFEVPEALSSGRLGMLGMRERVESLGGTISIDSAPGKGTLVRIDLPVFDG